MAMTVTHIYTGSDGQSHFRELTLPTTVNALSGRETVEYLPCTGAGLGEAAVAGPARDFHNAPRRQFVAVLTGALLIETGDGTQKRFGPGDIFLADDVTGQGHKTADVESPAKLLYVYVPDDFDPSVWAR